MQNSLIGTGSGAKTIIVAPPSEARIIVDYLGDQRDCDGKPVFDVIAREQELGPKFLENLTESTADVVVVHASAPGFRAKTIKKIISLHGQRARLVVAFVPRMGDWFDVVDDLGAVTYCLPLRPEPFRELAEELSSLLANVRGEYAHRSLASAVEAEEEAADVEQPEMQESIGKSAAGIRLPTQVITSWSSKGGDGKSLIAQELAWQLANIGGHKVLLVDADMSRGYLAQALNKDARKFAERHNITTLAQKFLVEGRIPPDSFDEHLYQTSDLNNQGAGNLRILFGLASPSAATLPVYTADHGSQGARFINELVKVAYGLYEFVIFDIGTAITIPVHYGAIKTAGHLLVVSTPFRPSVAPTRDGIRQLESHQAITRDQLRLVINRWSPEALIKRDELPDFLGIPLFAVIPLVEEGLLMGLINQGDFISEVVWREERKYKSIQPFVIGISSLAENFVPGVVNALKKKLDLAAKKRKRSGILRRI